MKCKSPQQPKFTNPSTLACFLLDDDFPWFSLSKHSLYMLGWRSLGGSLAPRTLAPWVVSSLGWWDPYPVGHGNGVQRVSWALCGPGTFRCGDQEKGSSNKKDTGQIWKGGKRVVEMLIFFWGGKQVTPVDIISGKLMEFWPVYVVLHASVARFFEVCSAYMGKPRVPIYFAIFNEEYTVYISSSKIIVLTCEILSWLSTFRGLNRLFFLFPYEFHVFSKGVSAVSIGLEALTQGKKLRSPGAL